MLLLKSLLPFRCFLDFSGRCVSFTALLCFSLVSLSGKPAVTIAPVDKSQADLFGREHMIQNQSKNAGIFAVPAPGEIVIDGDLGDWDLSGRISSFASYDRRDEFSVETALMWDADYLYIAYRFYDRTPAVNRVDPEVDAESGWKGDSFQIRAMTDKTFWVTGWFYTPKQQATILIDNWNNPANLNDGTKREYFEGSPGEIDLGSGIQMATTTLEDGYVQEIRLPWSQLYEEIPNIGAGVVFRMGFEYLWGDVTGNTWPIHRYADNLQPDADSRLFFWTAMKAWGDITLIGQSHIPVRQYRPLNDELEGPVEISLRIPIEAERFSVVIDDSEGKRVRNLIADVNPEDYSVGVSEDFYDVVVRWDGRSDLDECVSVGDYQVRGLWHEGIGGYLDTIFYNPGTPPWNTADSSGSWGADHSAPYLVAAAGDHMAIGWHFAEGGHGLIDIGPDGLKKWGEKRGAIAIAGDDDFIYSVATARGLAGKLCRFHRADGSYAFFERAGDGPRFDIPLFSLISGLGQSEDPDRSRTEVLDLATGNGYLYFALSDGRLVVLDNQSLETISEIPVSNLERVDVGSDGNLYVLAGGDLGIIDSDTGKMNRIPMPTMEQAEDLSVSPEGWIAVMDVGKDYQPKVYSPEGELMGRIARQGGRPIRGDYDPEAVAHVNAIAYDFEGNLWVTESWDYPRRVSVWNPDGKLARDYIGNTRYGATGSYMHDDNPNLGYVGPVEMKLNREDHSYEVTQIIWVSDPEREDEPELFTVSQGHAVPSRFTSSAGGVEREFLFSPSWVIWNAPQVVYMEDDDGWRPVSAFGHVSQLSGEMNRDDPETPLSGDFADLHPMDGFFWNDLNEDGRVQREECIIVPAGVDSRGRDTFANLHISNYWNNTINSEDLSFDGGSGYRIAPIRFTEKGAPVYGPEGVTPIVDVSGVGKISYTIPEEQLLVAFDRKERPNMGGFDLETKELVWTYPNDYSGVHGSHAAPMSAPGVIIGTLKVIGHGEVDGLGSVFAMRGNQGEDYYMTSDGLYIGAVFGDSRITENNLGETVEESFGYPLQGQPDEPFSGWFGKQNDGVFRNLTSLSKQAAVVTEIRGLETIQRFVGPRIRINAEDEAILAAYIPAAEVEEGEKIYTVAKTTVPIEWDAVDAMMIRGGGTPDTAEVYLQYDAENLYLKYEVQDRSPMANSGRDFRRLFKTGDAVDLQISAVPSGSRRDPVEGDIRILFSFLDEEPVAILMRPVEEGASELVEHTYDSGVGPKTFDRVEQIDQIPVVAKMTDSGYSVIATVPWAVLGIEPQPGITLYGDVGFISSDPSGRINASRTYWSNKATGLVSDEPLEAWLHPQTWGIFTL
ncbi:MAG: sugar-binding protein, partial [Puniceicoccales bacterium]